MNPEAAVAKPTTISSAARAGVNHSADPAASIPITLVKRISHSSTCTSTSIQFLQDRPHWLCQASPKRPRAPGELLVAGESARQVHQDDDCGDADRDFLDPVWQRDGEAAKA